MVGSSIERYLWLRNHDQSEAFYGTLQIVLWSTYFHRSLIHEMEQIVNYDYTFVFFKRSTYFHHLESMKWNE